MRCYRKKFRSNSATPKKTGRSLNPFLTVITLLFSDKLNYREFNSSYWPNYRIDWQLNNNLYASHVWPSALVGCFVQTCSSHKQEPRISTLLLLSRGKEKEDDGL